jgi:hypothetical protein
MGNITLAHGERHLRVLMNATRLTAVRYGLLDALSDAVTTGGYDDLATSLSEAAAPLCAALEVTELPDVPYALQSMTGRPPRRVMTALRGEALAWAVSRSFDVVGLYELADRARTWSPEAARGLNPGSLSADALAERRSLADSLRVRAREIYAAWLKVPGGVDLAPSMVMDGRALTAAARAWQLPLLNGTMQPAPMATAALHPNRLGRTAAIVAFSRAREALSSSRCVPDVLVFESVALLIAVGEAISGPNDLDNKASRSRRKYLRGEHGVVPVQVPLGESVNVRSGAVGEGGYQLDCWWPVFDSWGSQSARTAQAIPTAWKLTAVEADVLVWALCSVAVRLAVAAMSPVTATPSKIVGAASAAVGDSWSTHWASESSTWEAGARFVWSLMQGTRGLEGRTVWPGQCEWSLKDEASWPWRSA